LSEKAPAKSKSTHNRDQKTTAKYGVPQAMGFDGTDTSSVNVPPAEKNGVNLTYIQKFTTAWKNCGRETGKGAARHGNRHEGKKFPTSTSRRRCLLKKKWSE